MEEIIKRNIYDFCCEDMVHGSDSKHLIINIVVTIIGLAMIVIGFEIGGNPNLSSALLICGAIVGITGLIMVVSGKKKYLYNKTHSKLKKLEVFFNEVDFVDLKKMFDTQNFDDLNRFQSVDNTGLRVEALVSSDGQYTAILLEKYIPFSFSPVSDVVKFYDSEAGKMRTCLTELKNRCLSNKQ